MVPSDQDQPGLFVYQVFIMLAPGWGILCIGHGRRQSEPEKRRRCPMVVLIFLLVSTMPPCLLHVSPCVSPLSNGTVNIPTCLLHVSPCVSPLSRHLTVLRCGVSWSLSRSADPEGTRRKRERKWPVFLHFVPHGDTASRS